MQPLNYERVYSALDKHATGIDAFEIIPVPDLSGPLKHTVQALRGGMIPAQYAWTEEKTERAYSYKDFRKWAQSIIVAAKYYLTDEVYPDCGGYLPDSPDMEASPVKDGLSKTGAGGSRRPYGRIARFTWRNNYRYLVERLRNMIKGLERELDLSIRFKALSNYTSIPEKVLFAYSGLAVFGRNCVLLNKTMGSCFVVGELLTDLPVDFTDRVSRSETIPSMPDFSMCGNCRLCIDACPTGALLGEGSIDVNRCFQYLSENLVAVPHAYRSRWENRLYGCSTCLDVCPYNSGLKPSAEKHAIGYVGTGDDLINLLSFSNKQWQERFKDNQLIIRDRLAIIKNALLCLGNFPGEEAQQPLQYYLSHSSPVIRTYAAWALGKLEGKESRKALERRLKKEVHESVRNEIERTL